jgi:predicted DNA-binding transcriptional regulator YafY
MPEQEARASWSARTNDELTGAERLVVAILDHRVVRFRYQGHQRIVEPHLLGLHEAGEPMLVAYQTSGGSQSGQVPGWRTFITTSIEDVVIDDHHFPGPRGDLAVNTERMIEIFARA